MENPRKPQSGKGAGYGKPLQNIPIKCGLNLATLCRRVELGHVVQDVETQHRLAELFALLRGGRH